MGACVESPLPRFLAGLGRQTKDATGPSLSQPIAAFERTPRFVHVSPDSFYASVEQQLNPKLAGKPVLVGRSTVLSASQEAILCGVRPSCPLQIARQTCPSAFVVAGQFQKYAAFAETILEILKVLTPKIECGPAGDFYLDLAEFRAEFGEFRATLLRLQLEILAKTGLNVSIGAGVTRVVAATASRTEGPRGLKCIFPGAERGFLSKLPAKFLVGIDSRRAAHLADCDIKSVGTLARIPRAALESAFGKLEGTSIWHRARGKDWPTAHPGAHRDSIFRSVAVEDGTQDSHQLLGLLGYICERIAIQLKQAGKEAASVALAIRYIDSFAAQQSTMLSTPVSDSAELSKPVREIFQTLFTGRVPVEFVGVTVVGRTTAARAADQKTGGCDLPLAANT